MDVGKDRGFADKVLAGKNTGPPDRGEENWPP